MSALAELEARYATLTDPVQRKTCRLQARRLAAKLGIAAPEWAIALKPRTVRSPRQTAPVPRLARAKATSESDAAPAFAPVPMISDRLRAWRQRMPGTIIQMNRDGVIVHPYLQKPLRFRDVADAERELGA